MQHVVRYCSTVSEKGKVPSTSGKPEQPFGKKKHESMRHCMNASPMMHGVFFSLEQLGAPASMIASMQQSSAPKLELLGLAQYDPPHPPSHPSGQQAV